MNLVPISNSVAALTPAPHSGSSGPVQRPTQTEAASGKPRAQELEQAVAAANKFIEPAASNLEFQIDEQSGRTIMKLVDRETGSIIRQLPSEEMLAIARSLDKLQGLVIRLKG